MTANAQRPPAPESYDKPDVRVEVTLTPGRVMRIGDMTVEIDAGGVVIVRRPRCAVEIVAGDGRVRAARCRAAGTHPHLPTIEEPTHDAGGNAPI